jgi:hypothetical protein
LVKESFFQLFLDFWAQPLDYHPWLGPQNPPRASPKRDSLPYI